MLKRHQVENVTFSNMLLRFKVSMSALENEPGKTSKRINRKKPSEKQRVQLPALSNSSNHFYFHPQNDFSVTATHFLLRSPTHLVVSGICANFHNLLQLKNAVCKPLFSHGKLFGL
jgi:hypothetical protein